jgi:hypothetical protein
VARVVQEHARSVEAARACGGAAGDDDAPCTSDDAGGDGTAAAWDAFHRQHSGTAFFKPRRRVAAARVAGSAACSNGDGLRVARSRSRCARSAHASYLLKEFPQLAAQGRPLMVLEVRRMPHALRWQPSWFAPPSTLTHVQVGCGSGSAALPILRANPDARVVACDFAASAVAAAQAAAAADGAHRSHRSLLA